MSQITLQAEPRVPGRTLAKQLRRDDRIPGVYYAKGHEPVHFSVSKLAVRPIVYTAELKTIKLEVAGKNHVGILKDVVFDPVTDKVIHFDILGIVSGEKLAVEIPLHIVGNSIGVREGGILEHLLHKAHVKVDPTTMPEHINVDITDLAKGGVVHISDLSVPGVEFTDRPDAVIVACHPPKGAAAADEPAEKK